MTFQPKKLSLVGITLLVASIALIFLSKLAVNQVAFNLFLLSSFTDVAALNMYTMLFAVAGYVLMAAGAALFVYVAWRSRFVVDAPTVKRQLRVLIVAVAVLLVTLSLFCTQAASANSLATTGYYLATPYSPYDWLIGNFSSGSYYAINGSNWANMMTWPSPAPWSDYAGNSTQVIEAALAATTAGTVYLKEVPMDYGLTIPENVQVIENLNGLTRVFIDDGDSVGSPYTVSVDSVNPTYYTVQDCADRYIISWTSTNASYVVNSAISSVGIGGKIIFGSGVFNLANTIQMTTGSIILEGQGKGFGDTQRGTYLNGTSATVDVFTISGGTFHVIRDMEIHGGKSGIYASSAADLLLYDLSITLNAQYGVRITGMKHLVIDSCWIEQCTYDGVYIYDPSFSNKGQFRIVNSHVTLCGYNGIKVVGNDTSRGSIISTSNIEFNGYSGILAQGVLDLKILGNTFINNSVSTAGTYADIILTDSGTFNCSKVEIGSNTFRDFYPTSFAPYCVHVKRTSTDLLIHHNDFGSYTTAPILVDASAPGSSIRWSDNNGFVTERSFSGTNTTATTAVLNHGLYSNATSVWVSFSSSDITGYTWSSTATQVTISPTGTLPASWTCYVKAQYAP